MVKRKNKSKIKKAEYVGLCITGGIHKTNSNKKELSRCKEHQEDMKAE